MDKKIPFIHRDISWLSFNYRVLQEAKDVTVPLLERLKFLAIYSSNLNEFYRVRVANIRNLIRADSKKAKKNIDYDPKKILLEIKDIVNRQQEEFSHIFKNEIVPELKDHNIRILQADRMNEEQREFVDDYFKNEIVLHIQPVLLLKNKIRSFLNNAALYHAIVLEPRDPRDKSTRYAICKIPSDVIPRFLKLPSRKGRHDIILLDDIVRSELDWLFPGYIVKGAYSVKLSRDAELYIDDEFSGNLIQKIKKSLTKRKVGLASRFVYDRAMPKDLLKTLKQAFDLTDYDMLPEGRYHNNFDFFTFPDFNLSHLKNTDLPPIPYEPLEEAENIFDAMKERDHLINYPYQSYESVIRFFESASVDPNVSHIKITQYRVASESRIMNALMKAAALGKNVSAFVEVKARFDEEANLKWGEKLEAAGVKVHYSFPGLKVHSKVALVRRKEGSKFKLYSYLSTGNFHEKTAKLYTDYGFFTADLRIVNEVAKQFSFLETVRYPNTEFRHLLVGQFNLREEFEALVEQEIKNAKKGKKASIILKMNSLQDKKLIGKLYEADRVGVEVKLIIRGINCMDTQLESLSSKFMAVSIVDRFLEHSRVFMFHNDGKEKIYLSSADWMVRNLDYRIETAFPIYDPELQNMIKDVISIQLSDNVKSRIHDNIQENQYYKNNLEVAVRSQLDTYYYYKMKSEVIVPEEEVV